MHKRNSTTTPYCGDPLQLVKGRFVQAEGTVGYLAWLDGYSPATRGSNSYLEFLREAQ